MVARVLHLRMSVIREKRHQPPFISLSLRGRNEIDELLLVVHVELPMDIAPCPYARVLIRDTSFLGRCPFSLCSASSTSDRRSFTALSLPNSEVRDNLSARRRAFFFDESIYQFLIAGQSGPHIGHGKRDSHGVFAYVEFGFLLVFGI